MEERPNSTDRPQRQLCRGFTLIELSIVLVIVALVVTGIVFGREMITNAELRKMVTQAEGLILSVNTFKLKFNQLPGDMTNPYQVFGNACGNSGQCTGGNGDGKIGTWGGPYLAYEATSGIAILAWQE